MRVAIAAAAIAVACASVLVATETPAEACGCLNPPTPPPEGGENVAVNQSAEQIIFEVEEGFVTAHVLIRYAGKPSEFAWIVPVPTVPELSLSPSTAFALLDRESAPVLTVQAKNECPTPDWTCASADMPRCQAPPSSGCGVGCSGGVDGQGGGGPNLTSDAAGGSGGGGGGTEPPVEVLDRAIIGSYETVVFSAGNVGGALQWLRDEGFIVNPTMAPYLQSYSDANMLFLASKLIPGANTSDIRPLRMRYEAEAPMIPLQLTAVAAEPDMTITAYVYADQAYGPSQFDLALVDEEQLSVDSDGRINYPMVLRRAVDEAGGKSFVPEYSGVPVLADFDQGTGCCTSSFDTCGIASDGICSCPGNPIDAVDCEDSADLLEGARLLEELAGKHSHLTRLTTRMSAEDMTYDPVFTPQPNLQSFGRLALSNELSVLGACEEDIIDMARYDEIRAVADCASLYCGTGTCVLTTGGVGCDCDAGTTARRFIDLDGRPSTTCIPDTSPVDLSAGGLELPDVCATVTCGNGSCLDVGGFPTCQCDPGHAGSQAGLEAAPVCRPILARSTSAGAENFSASLASIPVCAPAPPVCGTYAWNVPVSPKRGRLGFECSYSVPSAADQQPVASPTCEDLGLRDENSGCSTQSASNGLASFGLMGMVFFLAFRRRRYDEEPRA